MIRRTLREAAGKKLSNAERLANIRHARGGKTRAERNAEEEEKHLFENLVGYLLAETYHDAEKLFKTFVENNSYVFDNEDLAEYDDFATSSEEQDETSFDFDFDIYVPFNGGEFIYDSAAWISFNNFAKDKNLRLQDGGYIVYSYDNDMETVYSPRDSLDSIIYEDLIRGYLSIPGVGDNPEDVIAWLSKLFTAYSNGIKQLPRKLGKAIEKKLDELEALDEE